MAAILGDLIQIIDYQTYLAQELMNVYYYRITNVTGLSNAGYTNMLEWFRDHVVTEAVNIQNDQLMHTSLELRNLSNNVDVVALVTGIAGTASGGAAGALPSYVSWGFKLVRESLVTRNGYKRIAGVPETWVSGNSPVAGIVPDLNDFAAVLDDDWTFGVVNTAEPVIVKRPINPPVGTTYQYASIGSALFTQLGTQNTRKA